ncbi:hypothetical protein [Caulobacter sp. 17J80-11]|uniref:hypothetical protein n=1 Tax=Caulobacter sp. 17J80-11 TaxID=2763502 RepID=UPI001653646A|nr:hypothetical protein [Caulobacter sp. 17J80-11]MBC6982561.1 hypothetical protein [Caulobacter sp. 17J80-11]
MTGPTWRTRLAPWAGLFAGPLAWWLHQQGMGALTFFDCDASTLATLLTGLVALLAVAAAGAWSWGAAARERLEPARDVRRFAGLVSAGAAVVFGLAIAFQTLAGALIPECAR